MLICLYASHIDSLGRLENFKLMLASWASSTVMVDLRVSISFIPELRIPTLAVLDATSAIHGNSFLAYYQDTLLAQFQHYHRLVTRHILEETAWIMFTDDDDIWHPERVQSIQNGLQDGLTIIKSHTINDGNPVNRLEYVSYIWDIRGLRYYFAPGSDPQVFTKVFGSQFHDIVFACFSEDFSVDKIVDRTRAMYFYRQNVTYKRCCPTANKSTEFPDVDTARLIADKLFPQMAPRHFGSNVVNGRPSLTRFKHLVRRDCNPFVECTSFGMSSGVSFGWREKKKIPFHLRKELQRHCTALWNSTDGKTMRSFGRKLNILGRSIMTSL